MAGHPLAQKTEPPATASTRNSIRSILGGSACKFGPVGATNNLRGLAAKTKFALLKYHGMVRLSIPSAKIWTIPGGCVILKKIVPFGGKKYAESSISN